MEIIDEKDIDYERIGKEIKKGSLIIYPTDTVYGVGGSLTSVEKIYRAKERSFKSPLIALISSREKIEEIAWIPPEKKEKIDRLVDAFWPGGLTLILRRKGCIPKEMVSGGETVGIRMPDHPIALGIIEAAGGVLPTTSANISGDRTPTSYGEVSWEFKERIEITIAGGECPKGVESTILDMSEKAPKILRLGAVSKEEIEKILGKI